MIETINVDLNKLFVHKLKLEDYFILYCLVNQEEELLIKYTTCCQGIDTNVFQKLRNLGFIILTEEINITFSSIKTTLEAEKLFNVVDNQQFEALFKELLSTYPGKVKDGFGGIRRLHNDLKRCKKIYKVTIKNNNVELHKKILLCIQFYYKEHIKSGKEQFMQLLGTFLGQETWKQYIEEIVENKPIIQQSDDI